jgi:hypothetical protein
VHGIRLHKAASGTFEYGLEKYGHVAWMCEEHGIEVAAKCSEDLRVLLQLIFK